MKMLVTTVSNAAADQSGEKSFQTQHTVILYYKINKNKWHQVIANLSRIILATAEKLRVQSVTEFVP